MNYARNIGWRTTGVGNLSQEGHPPGNPPHGGAPTVSEPAAAAHSSNVRQADADAMGRMILRYGRYVRNATRHITLLRG